MRSKIKSNLLFTHSITPISCKECAEPMRQRANWKNFFHNLAFKKWNKMLIKQVRFFDYWHYYLPKHENVSADCRFMSLHLYVPGNLFPCELMSLQAYVLAPFCLRPYVGFRCVVNRWQEAAGLHDRIVFSLSPGRVNLVNDDVSTSYTGNLLHITKVIFAGTRLLFWLRDIVSLYKAWNDVYYGILRLSFASSWNFKIFCWR